MRNPGQFRRAAAFCGMVLLCGGMVSAARADRIVLSPDANALPPNGLKAEFGISPYRRNENVSWFQFAAGDGFEIEGQRFSLASDTKPRFSLSVQYPVLSDFGVVPALSVGVRDLLNTGIESRAFYLAFGKSLPLSSAQARILRELRVNVGIGSGRLHGPFVGVVARFARATLSAEWYRSRPNISIGLPLVRNMQAKAYSLDGTIYYGLSYTLVR